MTFCFGLRRQTAKLSEKVGPLHGADPQPLRHLAHRVTTINNLRHSVLFELVCKPYSLVHIRLSLVPKLPSKASTNLGAPQPGLLDRVAFGLLAPHTLTVRRTPQSRGNGPLRRCIAGLFDAVLSKQPNPAFAKFNRIGGGETFLRHNAHPLTVLLSAKPGPVHTPTKTLLR